MIKNGLINIYLTKYYPYDGYFSHEVSTHQSNIKDYLGDDYKKFTF